MHELELKQILTNEWMLQKIGCLQSFYGQLALEPGCHCQKHPTVTQMCDIK